jgi:carboxymethylenebutenolidase
MTNHQMICHQFKDSRMPEIEAGELRGFLAVPGGEGPWPGVVVLHEVYGLNDDIRGYALRFAEAGYLAFAPDLYTRGARLRCVLRAFRDLAAHRGQAFDDIEAARLWVTSRADCTGRAGVIGFCLGGGFALLAAARHDYAAASVNYAPVPRNATEVLAGTCPVVAGYGGRDRTLPRAAAKLEKALAELGVPHDVREYPDAGHAFLNRHQPWLLVRILAAAGFREAEAAEAWTGITGFFAEHLAITEGTPR